MECEIRCFSASVFRFANCFTELSPTDLFRVIFFLLCHVFVIFWWLFRIFSLLCQFFRRMLIFCFHSYLLDSLFSYFLIFLLFSPFSWGFGHCLTFSQTRTSPYVNLLFLFLCFSPTILPFLCSFFFFTSFYWFELYLTFCHTRTLSVKANRYELHIYSNQQEIIVLKGDTHTS